MGMFGEAIADTELGVLFRNRAFQKVLAPGTRTHVPGLGRKAVVKRIDLTEMPVKDPVLEKLALTHADVVARFFVTVDTGDQQAALVFADGKLVDLIGPGERAFFAKGLREIRAETVDAATAFEVPQALTAAVTRMAFRRGLLVEAVTIPAERLGLLFVDGVFQRQLPAGRYAFIKAVRRIDVEVVDLRLQTLEVQGQEVLTRDRIGIRANVTALFRVFDPEKAVAETADLKDFTYKAIQFALREVIGTRTLEEVLGDKQGINAALAERLQPQLEAVGLKPRAVGVKDIILPGDVRELMNRVIDAEKTAQANVIRRREETAATRALLNTAKLMEDNPVLLRLKELEALEKVVGKVGNVIVGSGMDGVLEDLVRIAPRDKTTA